MRNKLTYCERASETIHKNIIQRDVETKKLNRINHDGMFHQWDLFDSYMATFIQNLEKKRIEEEIKMKGSATEKKRKEYHGENLSRPSLLKALKLLERQIMQIKNQDKYLFYREWNKFDDSQESSKMLYMLLSFPQLKIYLQLDMEVMIFQVKKKKKVNWMIEMMKQWKMVIFMFSQ